MRADYVVEGSYALALSAFHVLQALIYARTQTIDPPEELRRAWRRMTRWTAGIVAATLVAMLVTGSVALGIRDARWAVARGHAFGLALAAGYWAHLAWEWRSDVRIVTKAFGSRWIAAPRGGWRSVLEWSISLAVVGAAMGLLVTSLAG